MKKIRLWGFDVGSFKWCKAVWEVNSFDDFEKLSKATLSRWALAFDGVDFNDKNVDLRHEVAKVVSYLSKQTRGIFLYGVYHVDLEVDQVPLKQMKLDNLGLIDSNAPMMKAAREAENREYLESLSRPSKVPPGIIRKAKKALGKPLDDLSPQDLQKLSEWFTIDLDENHNIKEFDASDTLKKPYKVTRS